MNRVDVVDLVVDLVDVDLDVDLVDVVSLSSGCIFIFWPLGPRLYFKFVALDYTSVNQDWLGPKAKILKFRLDILASDWGRPPAVFGASLYTSRVNSQITLSPCCLFNIRNEHIYHAL